VIRRWGRYVRAAYPPAIQLPYMISWAVGLTALFACLTGDVHRWWHHGGLLVTVVTLVLDMLLLRALDDIRDHDYDREHNPGRPLPSGIVSEADLVGLVALGCAVLLALNAWRGIALVALVVQLVYSIAVIATDRVAGWPPGDRLGLHLAVNLPIQPLLSLYVYASFLHDDHRRVSVAGLLAVVAVTCGGLCLELGRKATRSPKPGERTYATVLGPALTSALAVASAVCAAGGVLAVLAPWDGHSGGYGWGWLVLAPPLFPAFAAARFANGTPRWPVAPTIAYVPVMYASFVAVGILMKGVPA
jgi:hypothetical protein